MTNQQCPSTDEGDGKSDPPGDGSTIEKKRTVSSAGKGIETEVTVFSEIRQAPEDKSHVSSLICR